MKLWSALLLHHRSCCYSSVMQLYIRAQMSMIFKSRILYLKVLNSTIEKCLCLIKQKLLNIVRIINLMGMLQLTSQRLVYAIVYALNGLGISNSTNPTNNNNNNNLINNRLSQSYQTLNELITSINRKQSLSNLKDLLLVFHLAYPPKRTFEDIIPVYLHSFITREALCNLVSLVGVYSYGL